VTAHEIILFLGQQDKQGNELSQEVKGILGAVFYEVATSEPNFYLFGVSLSTVIPRNETTAVQRSGRLWIWRACRPKRL